jgi:hypothetical protein
MLKDLMLSGWFRVQPFLKYTVFVMLIAPFVAASAHTTSAKQTQAVAIPSVTTKSDSVSASVLKETAGVEQGYFIAVSKAPQFNSFTEKSDSVPMSIAAVSQPQIQVEKIEVWTVEDDTSEELPPEDPLATVELAPPIKGSQPASEVAARQQDLVQRLKASKVQALVGNNGLVSSKLLDAETLEAAKIDTLRGEQQKSTAVPVEQPTQEAQAPQQDPVGSPHPIPWQWIQATQEAIASSGGSGVRYYRSVPVISPDGRYVMYSRVQLEVKPQMYNSRVTSVLFVEDRQTRKLHVVSSTAPIHDPLLKQVSASTNEAQGMIAVLVPVSWSKKGDRFLARKFEGAMNTSDVTDHAVIWDRQQNRSQSVTPAQEKHKHEIAVLLGWSKTQPEQVLFRAGELGEEEWPLLTVGYNGETVAATSADQAVTYGQRLKEVWAGPQVAYR